MSELILNPNINDFIYNGSNNMELYYNGSKLWPSRLYNVTTSGSHGTVTASPTEGPNGTIVTLSNTPDTDYAFSSYSVTGATLSGNQFTINGSDVNVVGNFVLKKQEYVNLGTKEYTGTTSTLSVPLTGMPSSTTFRYLVFRMMAVCTGGSSSAADIWLRNSSNGGMWRMRGHFNLTNTGFVGITGNVTGWTTASGETVTSYTKDGVSYRMTSRWPRSTNWYNIKIIFDRTANRGYFYVATNQIGYVTFNTDPINIKNIGLQKEQSSSAAVAKVKNVKVCGFINWDDAVAY